MLESILCDEEMIEMKTLRPRIILEGTCYAATKDIAMAISKPGNSSRLERFESIVNEQNLLRHLAATSILPTIEIVTSENDINMMADNVADWIESIGADIPQGKENDDHLYLPAIY